MNTGGDAAERLVRDSLMITEEAVKLAGLGAKNLAAILVALAKEASIQDSVTKVFDLMGGVTNMIKPGTTVMLKPNAGHASPADTSVCTNPEVVRAVIREVKKANPKSIVIADSS